MLFLNDSKNHEWSYACLMTHTFALEPEELTAEMREVIEQAAEVVSVNLRGAYIYKSAADDDIDCFVLHSPAGYIMVMSSECARLNLETLAFILAEADHDASEYGPEIEYDCTAAYSKAQKRAQEAREPAKGDPAELQPSLEDGIAEFDKACKEIHAEMEAAFAPIQNEFDELRKQLDNELKL